MGIRLLYRVMTCRVAAGQLWEWLLSVSPTVQRRERYLQNQNKDKLAGIKKKL